MRAAIFEVQWVRQVLLWCLLQKLRHRQRCLEERKKWENGYWNILRIKLKRGTKTAGSFTRTLNKNLFTDFTQFMPLRITSNHFSDKTRQLTCTDANCNIFTSGAGFQRDFVLRSTAAKELSNFMNWVKILRKFNDIV